jgi:ABC-type lipopolysaccharide export system ATPase subunit
MNHTLEIDGIQLQFGERKILSDIYLQCETGKITGLLGKNGHGKSCLMKAIYGSLRCEKSVRFDRISIVESFKRPDLIVYLPQCNFIPKSLSLSRVFQDFDLEYSEFQNRFLEFAKREKDAVGSLSGGECRLLELYIIVRSQSLFALLDEPFTQLNPLQIEKAMQLLTEEKARKGILITDQMYRHVIDICDTLYVLTNGKTYLTKSSADIEALGYARLQ